MYEHLNKLKTIISSLQNQLEETEQQTKWWHQYRQRLEQVVSLVYHRIPEVGVTPNMIPKAWVIRLGEVATNFWQIIAKLEAKILPSTPPKLLEE